VGEVSNVFILGRRPFRLKTKCKDLLTKISDMFPAASENGQLVYDQYKHCETINLDVPIATMEFPQKAPSQLGFSESLAYVVDQALRSHKGLLWLEAATLLDAQGKPILICGASYAGKTTLSLALCLKAGWKMVSEDITMLDSTENCVIPFARPLSLRSDSAKRISEALGFGFENMVSDEWYFDPNMYYCQPVPLKFTRAVLLQPFKPSSAMPLLVEPVVPVTYLRKILSLSNFVRFPGAVEFFMRSLTDTECFTVQGGELKERLQILTQYSN